MKRIAWIDQLRGFSMMAILWFHTEMYYAGKDIIPYSFYVGDVLAVFFFISGYLFYDNKPFDAKRKVQRVFRGLIVPYFIFTTIITILKAIAYKETDNISAMLTTILTGEASWFVTALIVSELLFTAILSFTQCRKKSILAFALFSLLLTAILSNSYSPYHNPFNYWHINEAFLGCFLMGLGYLYHSKEAIIHQFNKTYSLPVVFLSIIILKIIIWKEGFQMILGPVMAENFMLFILDLLLSIVLLIGIFKRLPNINIIGWTGSHSLVYYFICGGVPVIISKLFEHFGCYYQHHYNMILPFILVYILSTMITYMIYRWLPFLIGASSK